MIDSYGAARLVARPRRPRAGGTMIDSYGALVALSRRPRAGGTMIDSYSDATRRSSPPAPCRWNYD